EACLTLLVAAGVALALQAKNEFQAVGTIKKVDAEKNVLYVHANGQDREVKIAKDVKVLDTDGKDLKNGLKAKEVKESGEVTITVAGGEGGATIQAIRLGKAPGVGRPKEKRKPLEPKASIGLKPLTEMSAGDKYKGEDGGLYGAGKNEPPESHRT